MAAKLSGGIAYLMKKNGITVIDGEPEQVQGARVTSDFFAKRSSLSRRPLPPAKPAPITARAQLPPAVPAPRMAVSFKDIREVVNGFRGKPFPDTPVDTCP